MNQKHRKVVKKDFDGETNDPNSWSGNAFPGAELGSIPFL